MAFGKMQFYIYSFMLPDGEHIGCAWSVENIAIARTEIQRVLAQNPEAKLLNDTLRKAKQEELDAAVEELRAKDPSRPLADNLGLDSPQRVLTNPEVVPGSQFVPEVKTLGDQ